jgi:signal transduction histidine kinase
MGRRIFGILFFLFVVSAIIGGLIAWAVSPGRGWFLLIGLGVVMVLGMTMRRAFSRTWAPVSDLIDATTRLGEGDATVRMKDRGRGPWQPVTSSFNSMAERLEDEDERRRRLLADLGHELRTPLTVIRGEIEAVLDGVREPESLHNVVDEVELMDRLLEDLRTLALAEAGRLELVLEPTNLGELVTDVVASYQSVMNEQGVIADVTVSGTELVEVDPLRVHQVISNLVSNALRVMPDGGRLDVNVDRGVMTVADTGPGISEDQLPFVFDRFVKASDSTGSGLGLSIARDLVEAHKGSITAGNRPGGGAVIQVELSYLRTSNDPSAD